MPQNFLTTALALCFLTHTIILLPIEAQVYSWKDAQGVTHYSTKPPHAHATPAELPKINRAPMPIIPQPTKAKSTGCDGRGGINCNAGSDSDGSVICHDGYTESILNFKSQCSAAKIELIEVSPLNPQGGFTVTVRNRRAAEATGVTVEFLNPLGKRIPLVGPETIDPFGGAEYVFIPPAKVDPAKGDIGLIRAASAGDMTINCASCE
jgi:hypothetical protein